MSLRLVELGFALLNAGAQHWRNMSSVAVVDPPRGSGDLSRVGEVAARLREHLSTAYNLGDIRGTRRAII
jgi:hypothetical protein